MLAERILAGDIRAAARLMRMADDRDEAVRAELKRIYPSTGRAHIVGITGNPGSGKSTLVDMLIRKLRDRGQRVGVVAIDPSSPFTGGAILGDRIRMQRHSQDSGVFIRSLATRGHLGGLTRSTNDIVTILDAMGFDTILIETVGVGQDEVDVVKTAHTSVVVLVPGLGDEIQIMKAGILEIADVFVVNKADRGGAERVIAELQTLQDLISQSGVKLPVPVLKSVAPSNIGIVELADAIQAHKQAMIASGGYKRREEARLKEMVASIVREAASQRFALDFAAADGRSNLTAALLSRTTSPWEVAEALLASDA